MAVPVDPSVTAIVTEGLKRGGRVNPTTAEITSATDHQLQEVKADLSLLRLSHNLLTQRTILLPTIGNGVIALPAALEAIESPLVVYDGPDDFRGTAQAGTSTTITLASTFPSTNQDNIRGKFIVITGGTGSAQKRQITAWNDSTKVATVDSAWTTIPDSTSTYLVVTLLQETPIWADQTIIGSLNRLITGRPRLGIRMVNNLEIIPVPDKVYAIELLYRVDIGRLDEAGSLFIELLREWRSVWIQGIAVKTMQRYDDERYLNELSVYQVMLNALLVRDARAHQVQFTDI